MKSKVGLIIPTWNVSITILKVLNSLSQISENFSEILIIDNDSQDDTRELLVGFVKNNPGLKGKTTILHHEKNYGYGSSIKTGFDYFLAREIEYVTILHSDHQTDAQKIMNVFFEQLKLNPEVSLILGSRFHPLSDNSDYSLVRKLGNYFFNVVTWLTTGFRMPDSGTAIIFVTSDLLKKIPYETFSNTWQFHPQLNIFFYSRKNIQIIEVPLDWANSEQASKLNLISYGLKLLKILVHFRVNRSLFRTEESKIFLDESIHLKKKTLKIFPQTQ